MHGHMACYGASTISLLLCIYYYNSCFEFQLLNQAAIHWFLRRLRFIPNSGKLFDPLDHFPHSKSGLCSYFLSSFLLTYFGYFSFPFLHFLKLPSWIHLSYLLNLISFPFSLLCHFYLLSSQDASRFQHIHIIPSRVSFLLLSFFFFFFFIVFLLMTLG